MGGNSRALQPNGELIIRNGKPIYAQKIDFGKKFDRSKFQTDFFKMMSVLNAAFLNEYGKQLWNLKTRNRYFNGSSSALFDPTISNKEFIEYKPEVGDVDMMVDHKDLPKLWDLLKANEGRLLGDFVYLGNNKIAKSAIVSQINAVLEYVQGPYMVWCQVDFEGADFENLIPTEWASFSHSSDWNDTKSGIKGVIHKFMIQSLATVFGKVDQSVELTPKSPVVDDEKLKTLTFDLEEATDQYEQTEDPKLRKKIADLTKEIKRSTPKIKKGAEELDVSSLTFSVLYGLRNKMQPQYLPNGHHFQVNSRKAFKQIPPAESGYVNDLREMFMSLFNHEPSPQELNKFKSFVGLIDLIAAEEPEKLIEIRDEFIRRLWGFTPAQSKGLAKPNDVKTPAQALDRDDWQTDLNIKMAALNHFFNVFNFVKLPKKDIDHITYLYYGKNGEAYYDLRSKGRDHDEPTG